MEEDRKFPSWVLPAAGVALVIALVTIGLARGPAAFDPDTPEGTVQLYIDALVEGEFENAASFWAGDGCVPDSAIPTTGAPDVSASLVSVDSSGSSATVVVRLTENSSDALGGLIEFEEWFTLVKQDDRWLIRQPSWPYYDVICEESA